MCLLTSPNISGITWKQITINSEQAADSQRGLFQCIARTGHNNEVIFKVYSMSPKTNTDKNKLNLISHDIIWSRAEGFYDFLLFNDRRLLIILSKIEYFYHNWEVFKCQKIWRGQACKLCLETELQDLASLYFSWDQLCSSDTTKLLEFFFFWFFF